MNPRKYKGVDEMTDLHAINGRLSSYTHDILDIKKKRIVQSDGSFTEELTYVLGQRYQDEDFLSE